MKEKINVLIVDDLELVHEPIQKFLQDFVFVKRQLIITNAFNATQAKRFLEEREYDIVMLDGDISGVWGYEIIKNIRQHNKEVIIISSSNHDDFNKKNVSEGADGSVNKIYLYEWNDKEGIFRTEKAKVIQELFEIKNKE